MAFGGDSPRRLGSPRFEGGEPVIRQNPVRAEPWPADRSRSFGPPTGSSGSRCAASGAAAP